MSKRKEIKQIILELESNFPVDTWMAYGLHVWPYLRIKLYMILFNKGKKAGPEIGAVELKNKRYRHSIFNSLIKVLKLPYDFIKLHFFFKRLGKRQLLFFGSHIHRVKYNEKYYNKYFDVMTQEHGLLDECYMIEFQKLLKPLFNEKQVIPLSKELSRFKKIRKVYGKQSIEKTFSLDNFSEFIERLKVLEIYSENMFTINAILKWAKKVKNTVPFFEKLFEKVNPDKIVFLSYYGFDDMAAALFAANNRSFKTFDMQHGPQTNVNMAYTDWTKVPKLAFNTMPKGYWLWDELTKENIDKWANENDLVSTEVVGNPFVELIREKVTVNSNQTILYCLQAQKKWTSYFFPSAVMELLRKSNFTWILRMHPRSSFTKEELSSFLVDNGIERNMFLIQNPYDKPLPIALMESKLHITNFSGSFIEANQLGVANLIIDSTGEDLFFEYFSEDNTFYVNKNDTLFLEKVSDILNNTHSILNKEGLNIYNPLHKSSIA